MQKYNTRENLIFDTWNKKLENATHENATQNTKHKTQNTKSWNILSRATNMPSRLHCQPTGEASTTAIVCCGAVADKLSYKESLKSQSSSFSHLIRLCKIQYSSINLVLSTQNVRSVTLCKEKWQWLNHSLGLVLVGRLPP